MKNIKRKILVLSLLCALSGNIYPSCINDIKDGVRGVGSKVFSKKGLCCIGAVGTVGCVGSILFLALLYNLLMSENLDDGDRVIRACMDNDLDGVKSVLRNVDDINKARLKSNWRDTHCSPVHVACEFNHVDILRWMVDEKGADVNSIDERTTFRSTTNQGPPTEQRTRTFPLAVASKRGNVQMVTYLLEKGAQVDNGFSKGSASLLPSAKEDTVIYVPRKVTTPLYIACKQGHIDVVRVLLDNGGVNLESNNFSQRSFDLVEGPKAFKGMYIFGYDADDEKPLHAAARMGHVEIVRELLQHGAVVDSTNANGDTPLMVAVGGGVSLGGRALSGDRRLELVRELLQNGANVDVRNANGETPLMMANDARIVECLLENGADINAESNEGKNALYFACINNRLRIVSTLITRGAEVKDEYKDEGICRQGDKSLDFLVQQELNNAIGWKKIIKKCSKKLQEGPNQKKFAEKKERFSDLLSKRHIPASAKKEMLPELFEMHKKNILSSDTIEKCLKTINFDKDFEKEEYKEVVAFTKAKKIKDINGKALT